MRVLIRFLARNAASAGAIESSERIYDGDVVTLGRATDQVVQFKDRRVAFRHARITRRDGRLLLNCRPPAMIAINGALVRDAELRVGDVVRLGANVLTLLPSPEGFDLAVSFELDPVAAAADGEVPATSPLRIRAALVGRRGWSMLAFGGVLCLTLLVPALVLTGPTMRGAVRNGPLPSDRAWSSGAMHVAHRLIDGRCEACHQQPFAQVRDAACLACHGAGLHDHVAAASPRGTLFDQTRCTDCHGGHEPALLVQRRDQNCSECHAARDARLMPSGVAASPVATALPATDFGHAHPQLRVSMRAATSDAPATRIPVDTPGLREDSGLRFTHAKHLDPGGVRGPRGSRVLGCGDCHQPEPGGARMQPVRMERHCLECHRLDFDPANPDRRVPHGDVRAVLDSLVEYYSARYLEGWPDPLARSRDSRWLVRPGVALGDGERARRLGLARQQALRIARDLFERRSCHVCHDVRATPGGPTPWVVTPVALTRDWMPAARFNHASHGTTLSACLDCHAGAARSIDARDVLMPAIDTCRRCHAGTTGVAAGRLASACGDCHAFHDARHERWRSPGPAPAAGALAAVAR